MKPGQQAGGGARATFHIVPAEVHIGEPFVVRLEVQHDSADGLKSQAKPPFAKTGEDWMLIRGPETRTLGRLGAQETTQVEWTYLSLQPGDHDTGAYTLSMQRGDTVDVAPATLHVLGELDGSETAPRPMQPALPAPAGVEGSVWLWAGPLLLLTALVAFVVLRRRQAASAAESQPVEGPLDRLKAAQWNESDPQGTLYLWHRELRAWVDGRSGRDGAALTDSRWLETLPAQAVRGEAARAELAGLLAELERCKYQLPAPGRLTGEQLGERVRAWIAGQNTAEVPA